MYNCKACRPVNPKYLFRIPIWVLCLDRLFGLRLNDQARGGKDIDRELMRQTEAWLFSHGWAEIWAATRLL